MIASRSSHLATRSTFSLLRSWCVFKACMQPALVKNGRSLLAVSVRTLGPSLTAVLVRSSFFAQFCGGETLLEAGKAASNLRLRGVGTILDYAAEADESVIDGSGSGSDSSSESALDAATVFSESAIRAAPGGFAAVKISSIADPTLLAAVTEAMQEHRRSFRAAVVGGGASLAESNHNNDNIYITASLDLQALTQAVAGRGGGYDMSKLFKLMDVRKIGRIDYLDYCDILRLLAFGSSAIRTSVSVAAGGANTDEGADLLLTTLVGSQRILRGMITAADRAAWARVAKRVDKLAIAAYSVKTALMIDAEYTYLQPAIDLVAVTAQRRWHRDGGGGGGGGGGGEVGSGEEGISPPNSLLPEEIHVSNLVNLAEGGVSEGNGVVLGRRPLFLPIFNTYQAYLRNVPSRLELALIRARRENWTLAAKLVRGAYLIQERARAARLGYSDPIQPTIEMTHDAYDAAVARMTAAAVLGEASLMVATHNATSITRAEARLQKPVTEEVGGGVDEAEEEEVKNSAAKVESTVLPLSASSPGAVSFGQLLGMSDHLTYDLVNKNRLAYKYVPFGRALDVVPYLLRRAEENADVLGGVTIEIEILEKELKERFLGGARGS